MREKLVLKHYPFFSRDRLPDLTVEVEYVPVPHWASGPNCRGGRNLAYEIVIDGKTVGKIEHATENTDRHYNRIRVPGRGRLAWSWRSSDGKSNAPGLYATTRRHAVAKVMGYDDGAPA